MGAKSLTGYRRPDGRVGVRNHVILLPADDLANVACQNAARIVPGTVPLPHHYGRVQFGDDLELTRRTLIGAGANPNVFGAVVVGIEPKWTDDVADGIASTGKPVEALAIERAGELAVIARAARAAQSLLQEASVEHRVLVHARELIYSIKCGESDTTNGLASCGVVGAMVDDHITNGGTVIFGETTELTGAEDLIRARCLDERVRGRFDELFAAYARFLEDSGADLLGSQPTEGNIRGGISTIEEKALGSVAKTGSAPIVDALDPATPPSRRGLNFMNSSSAGGECLTLMAAAGACLNIFATGQGNVIGSALMPVIKVTANPLTAQQMAEHIDLDVSDLLNGGSSTAEANKRLLSLIVDTINGRLTAAEALGHHDFVLTKLHQSA